MFQGVYENLRNFYHSQHAHKLDWITQNKLKLHRIHKDAQKAHKKHRDLPNRKNILFWSTTSWERGSLEYMLAYALWTRGHSIQGVRCSGKFPTCSMASLKSLRPSCDECISRSTRLLDVFKLEPFVKFTNSYLDEPTAKKISQTITDLERHEFESFQYRSIPIGKIVKRDLPQYYFSTVDITDPSVEDYVRDALISSSLYSEAALNSLEESKPDICIVTSGKTIGFAPFYQACLSKGIKVMTWDECGYERNGFIFSFNNFANEYHLDEIWENVKETILTEKQENFLDAYLNRMRKGNVGTALFYPNPVYDHDQIRNELNIPKGKKIVALLANITWDTSCLGRDTIFNNMFDWICQTIDFYKKTPDCQLVIRCHPSEGNVPDYIKSDEKISDMILEKYKCPPENISIITGDQQLNSHALCEMSDLILVYTTFVGLEMAIKGRKVIVCGEAHYRNKGFTYDANSTDEYFLNLSNNKFYLKKEITPSMVDLARRYAYTYINRIHLYMPEFDVETRHTFTVDDASDFLPGKSTRWDNICESFISDGQFINCTKLPE